MTVTQPQYDLKKEIVIVDAHLHNLKNITVSIPRNKLVVITGLSGSGKSSLAFDTLYAEGQRRYVESLSAYARQFLGRLNKPQVEDIKGIAPAVAIQQKVNTTNPRSTVGTSSEIYDYLKLLFARVGRTFSPISGKEVKKHQVADVVQTIQKQAEGSKWLLLSPVHVEEDRTVAEKLNILQAQGFARIKTNNEVLRIDQIDSKSLSHDFFLVIDRIVVRHEEDFYNRLGDAVQQAFYEGKGSCLLENVDAKEITPFSNKFEADGIEFLEPNPHLFSFNNPYGACPKCEGFGDVIGIDPQLVIPNSSLSVFENAVFPWRGDSMSWYKDQFIKQAYKLDFPIHKPYFQLTDAQKELLWEGDKTITGIHGFFTELEAKNYKIQNRVMLSRYRGKTKCPLCKGSRLRKEASYVKVGGQSIGHLAEMPLGDLYQFIQQLELAEYDQQVAKRILKELTNRLKFLTEVGLEYLTLSRKSNTLSGGESQRINLATSLGNNLVGSMYILDEPSIGLHAKDTEKLIGVLKSLRDLGNTVIVVEHDEDIMREADYIIDIGPEAGYFGGEVVAKGSFEDLLNSNTLTGQYLSGNMQIDIPQKIRKPKGWIQINHARENNLKNITVQIPLGNLTVVSGVSGSGKSTLIRKVLYPALLNELGGYGEKPGDFDGLEGDLKKIEKVELIDQNPIGRSSRSNPVTYVKAYDDIRALFAGQKRAQLSGLQPKHFSFNVDGGRCDTCKGEGEVTVEMQFMADVHLECEQCGGKRFKKEVLEITYQQKNIDDVLRLTVDEAMAFFSMHNEEKITQKLKPLQDVGLGYVQLGQSSSTLSGGEAQRIKLATFLTKGSNKEATMFIFDEPTTGLHFHDIKKLLKSFYALLDNGHSIIVIEHHPDLIKCADYLIDLGPVGGEKGGHLVASGTPKEVSLNKNSITGMFLKAKL
ncbi:MAG: excinuclease ABC subunit UvrA [Flavobacteriaceae bacterium]|nr:excinuclease ABC subunit UvrA [Flavobacteriaceae bacterium]